MQTINRRQDLIPTKLQVPRDKAVLRLDRIEGAQPRMPGQGDQVDVVMVGPDKEVPPGSPVS